MSPAKEYTFSAVKKPSLCGTIGGIIGFIVRERDAFFSSERPRYNGDVSDEVAARPSDRAQLYPEKPLQDLKGKKVGTG